MTQVYRNHPFLECVQAAEDRIKSGWMIYQKFSCEKCMERLTIPDANKFYTTGSCQKCGHVTDIVKTGCNYSAVWSNNSNLLKQLVIDCRSEQEMQDLQAQRAKGKH